MENNNLNVSLEWDSTIENEGSAFVVLPDGIYPFVVTGFERSRHDGSAKLPPCNKAVLSFEVDGGALGTATIMKHQLFLHSKTEGLLCEFFTAIGLRKHGERFTMNWDKVLGATGWCEVYTDEYIDKNGVPRKNNKIKRFVDPEDAPKPVQPAPAQPMKRWTPNA